MGLEKIFDFILMLESNKNIKISNLKKDIFANDPFLQKLQIETANKYMEFIADENHPIIKYYPYSVLEIAWTHSAKTFIYGGFKFSDWFIALSLKSNFWKIDFSLAAASEVPDELKHFEKLSWFEEQSWCDDWRFGCFIQEKGIFPPQLAFFDKNWFTKLNMSFDEYFEAMFSSCAVAGWQYFYIDRYQEIPNKQKAIDDMEKAVTFLPQLFPEMDFSYHKSRLEFIKNMPH